MKVGAMPVMTQKYHIRICLTKLKTNPPQFNLTVEKLEITSDLVSKIRLQICQYLSRQKNAN
jgi:hypothetical protein